MRILGLYDDHNCGAAVIEDGRILAAIEEERLSRIKLHNGNVEEQGPRRVGKNLFKLDRDGRKTVKRRQRIDVLMDSDSRHFLIRCRYRKLGKRDGHDSQKKQDTKNARQNKNAERGNTQNSRRG